jgi:pilus assembly protein CpaF
VGVTGRAEGDVIETSELFGFVNGQLRRADGYPPHAERYEQAGYELGELLGGDLTGSHRTASGSRAY